MYNEIIKHVKITSIMKQLDESNASSECHELAYFECTHLGSAILKSSLAPEEGLLVYLDLLQAQKRIILSNELHLLYLLTPVSLSFRVNWHLYH